MNKEFQEYCDKNNITPSMRLFVKDVWDTCWVAAIKSIKDAAKGSCKGCIKMECDTCSRAVTGDHYTTE